MKQLITDFPIQLHEALIIGQNYRFLSAKKAFSNVVLTGLGGSGIGGSIIQNYVFDKLKVPFIVNKDYFLPAFADENTLVIVCSYSGNTEETLQAMQSALTKNVQMVCITSGGKVGELASSQNIKKIRKKALP